MSIENNLMIELCERAMRENDFHNSLYLKIVGNQNPSAIAIKTAHPKLLISHSLARTEVANLALEVFKDMPQLTGVIGPQKETQIFANYWLLYSKAQIRHGRGQRIYRLDALLLPQKTPGKLRGANNADLELMASWGEAFFKDTFQAGSKRRDIKALVKDYVDRKYAYIWEDQGPKCMLCSLESSRTARIAFVYTPDEYRNNGYASNAVFELAKVMQEKKLTPTLYTDRFNPISNHVYQNLGFVQQCDVDEYLFN